MGKVEGDREGGSMSLCSRGLLCSLAWFIFSRKISQKEDSAQDIQARPGASHFRPQEGLSEKCQLCQGQGLQEVRALTESFPLLRQAVPK